MRHLGREEVREMTWGGSVEFEVVDRSFSRTSRWENWWWIVFRYDGQLWRVEFNEGATEMQEPEYPELFTPERVEPVDVTVTRYEPVDAEVGSGAIKGEEQWLCREDDRGP